MSERKWTRRTWDGRLEILNYPFSEKALTSLGKDSAMALANEIFATYHTIAPPKQWEGKLWVQIVTGNATYRILCVSVADAMGTMNGLADLIDSGKCIRRMLRAGPDYPYRLRDDMRHLTREEAISAASDAATSWYDLLVETVRPWFPDGEGVIG